MPHQQPQNILQQQQQQQHIWSLGSTQPQNVVNFLPQIESINEQQMKLREQITTSEKNLSAQHQVIGRLHSQTVSSFYPNYLWIF